MNLSHTTTVTGKNRKQIIASAGLNYSQGTKDGELAESWGLSSARFPCLSQRDGRKTAGTYTSPTGLYARGKLCVVDGADFLYDGKVVGHVTAGEKQFATINTKVVIFPDKVYYDMEAETSGMLAAEYPGLPGDVTFAANTLTVPEQGYIDQAAENAETKGSVAVDTSITAYAGASVDKATGALTMSGGATGTPDKLKAGDYIQYDCDSFKGYMVVQSSAKQSDGTYQTTYLLHTTVLYKYPGFDELSKARDIIEISGCTTCAANNGSHITRSLEARELILTKSIFTKTGVEAGTVMLERKVPDLTCICECGNRIWGAEGKTIYASALGDSTSFYVYDGVSTDSYAVAVGTEGEFTRCITYSSTVLFWRENYLHKALGSYPAQCGIYTCTVSGIQKGSEKSLAVINETLFYKGRNGVYAYSGGTPELLMKNFGAWRFFDAVGGTDDERYYISIRAKKDDWELYVFDTLWTTWLREDATRALDQAYLDGTLYFLDGITGKLVTIGQDYSEEGLVNWSAALCQMDETSHGHKCYSKPYLRADLEAGVWFRVEISTDGKPFRQVFSTHNERAKILQVPILPMRCDNFRIRLSGESRYLVKSIIREFALGNEYQGGDRAWQPLSPAPLLRLIATT